MKMERCESGPGFFQDSNWPARPVSFSRLQSTDPACEAWRILPNIASWPRPADWLSDWLGRLRFGAPTRVQLNALRAMGSDGDRDLVISAPTGSGKTLAYLLPALTALSDQLMQARDLCRSLFAIISRW